MIRSLICFSLFTTLYAESLNIDIETPYAILINADTGKVLFEKNARSPIYPASTTKIASVLYLLTVLPQNLEGSIAATKEALAKTTESEKKSYDYALPSHLLEVDGTSLYLREKEVLSIKDLLWGAIIASANDASNVLASYVAGDISIFSERVNEMVKKLGCENTHFCNPHGLHHPDHVSTAYDMALITKEALKYPFFREIAQSETFTRPKTNFRPPQEYRQSNLLLRKGSKYYYPKAIGVKTGFHKAAKFNLVAAATDGNRTLIAVLHKSETSQSRFRDAIKMFETAFKEKMESRLLFKGGEFAVEKEIKQGNRKLLAGILEDIVLEYYPSEEQNLHAEICWNSLSLPIHKDDVVGSVHIKEEGGRVVKTAPLIAKNLVQKQFFAKIFGVMRLLIAKEVVLSGILITIICLIFQRYNAMKKR